MTDVISEAPRRGPGRPRKLTVQAPPASTPAPSSGPTPSRRTRKPFGGYEQKLAFPTRPGYRRYIFNDDGRGRIDRAREAGYEHVKDHEGKNVSRVVGVAETGGPLVGYLMEIPEEWYKEDMAAEQARIDEMDRAIRRGQVNSQEGDGRYIPRNPDGSSRIKIEVK